MIFLHGCSGSASKVRMLNTNKRICNENLQDKLVELLIELGEPVSESIDKFKFGIENIDRNKIVTGFNVTGPSGMVHKLSIYEVKGICRMSSKFNNNEIAVDIHECKCEDASELITYRGGSGSGFIPSFSPPVPSHIPSSPSGGGHR